MASVPAMTSVHEHMHQRACENEEVGQVAKSVREVLGPKQDPADDNKGGADEKRP
jgi:hypothetical protein